MKYHKLVRDRIPEIIKASGDCCVTEILSQEEYVKQLDQKLQEELTEYYQEPCLEELADLLEVIHAVAVARGYTVEQLEEKRAKKAQERGGFENRILLKEVITKSQKE
ncbi:MAG: phosphoribosyl-ATP pyrophosphohydrolase [Massiliimalia sp.]